MPAFTFFCGNTPMRSARISSLLFLIALVIPPGSFCTVADTTPPSFSWISPTPFSVISTNTVRLAADAYDDSFGSGIEKVVFYAQYYDFFEKLTQKKMIGEVSAKPYEILWDCSSISDQHFQNLILSCMVIDRAGNTRESDINGNLFYNCFTLDRNKKFNPTRFICRHTSKKIILDGRLSEWASADSVTFTNNDNTICVYSMWDGKYLYFASRVKDRSVISVHTPLNADVSDLWAYDSVEFYLDTDHNRSEIFESPDCQILCSPAGKIIESQAYRDPVYKTRTIAFPKMQLATTIDGTLNKDTDNDRGYIIEAAIPWKELNVKPGNGEEIGLELWNSDRDFIYGQNSVSGWTTNVTNIYNPSEWGSLALEGERSALYSAVILFFMLVLPGALYIFIFRRKKTAQTVIAPIQSDTAPIESEYIRKAREYTAQLFSDETLDRGRVAAVIGLNPTYFGQLFKNETGVHFSEYLTALRIEKAKTLLRDNQKNVAEIAFEVGFSSQSYFGFIFKKATGLSPKQYRAGIPKEE